MDTNHLNQLAAQSTRNAENVIRARESELNQARRAYNCLVKYIQQFEKDLDNEHEIGARLVSFGSSITFHIQNIGYVSPDIISFYGQSDEGQNIQLIQNISQLSVLLIGMKKINENPRRIGFNLDSEKS